MENPVITGFFGPLKLLPLNRRRRLTGNVIHNPVDPLHLVDDPHGDPVQHVVRDPSPVSRHEIIGGHRSEGQGVVVGPAIPHDPHRAGVGEHR